MLDYHFNLTTNQSASNPALSVLQKELLSAGILLDFMYEGGKLGFHIRLKDKNPVPADPDKDKNTVPTDTDKDKSPVLAEPDDISPRRGRRPMIPKCDLTLAQVREMHENGKRIGEIADMIGVSRRTFFRKWAAARDAHLEPGTPFSEWSGR